LAGPGEAVVGARKDRRAFLVRKARKVLLGRKVFREPAAKVRRAFRGRKARSARKALRGQAVAAAVA
jgi:hypothetical protein